MTNVRFQTSGLNTLPKLTSVLFLLFLSGGCGSLPLLFTVWRMGNVVSELQVNCFLFFCSQTSPNKAEFIRAKYQMLAFVHRLPCRDDDSVTAKDLSKVGHTFQNPEITGWNSTLSCLGEKKTLRKKRKLLSVYEIISNSFFCSWFLLSS